MAIPFRRSFANTLLQGGTRPFPKQRASSRLGTGGRKSGALRCSKWSPCSHIRWRRFWRPPCSASRGRVAARALRNQQPGGVEGATPALVPGLLVGFSPCLCQARRKLHRQPSVRIGLPQPDSDSHPESVGCHLPYYRGLACRPTKACGAQSSPGFASQEEIRKRWN